jgi:hypothetical protein
MSAGDYQGRVVCAHGVVQVESVQGSTFPAIDIRTRQGADYNGGCR